MKVPVDKTKEVLQNSSMWRDIASANLYNLFTEQYIINNKFTMLLQRCLMND